MSMATAIQRHWPKMTMLILLFITSLQLDVNMGQEYCGSSNYCPSGQCCSNNFLCGNTSAFCGLGNCSYQCAGVQSQCGPAYNNAQCPDGLCCSTSGWCGSTLDYCGKGNCSYQCPNGTCGSNGGNCPDGNCCNTDGFCGNDLNGYCHFQRCASQCPLLSPTGSPSLAPSLAPVPGITGGRKTGRETGIIIGTSLGIGSFILCCIVVALFVLWRRFDGWTRFTKEDPVIPLEGMPERFSYRQLSIATKGFSKESELGQGGFGSVYRGELPSSRMRVAVKKISSDSNQGEREFIAEVSIISQLRHRNLIQLQGWCQNTSKGQYLLVYELMPNGSLDKVLFGPAESQMACLSWQQRLNIVTGIAAAVDYLHRGWKQQVIHRDIKSSNIMLDAEWNAKLGDFGLARLVDHSRAAATTIVAGTYGYIAPEAATSGRFTDKTDVFAFGAVVLEIMCGRRALSSDFPPEQTMLVDWVWRSLSEDALLSTVDKQLEDYDKQCMEVVLTIGLWCSHPNPLARPSMQQVVEVLAGDVQVPSIPNAKPVPFSSPDPQNFLFDYMHGSMSRVSTKTFDATQGSTVKSTSTSPDSPDSTSSFLEHNSSCSESFAIGS